MKIIFVLLFIGINFFACAFGPFSYQKEYEDKIVSPSPSPARESCVEANYRAKSETDLAAMTLLQLVDEEVKAQLLHNTFDSHSAWADYTDLVRKRTRKAGVKLLPLLTEYINAYDPQVPKTSYKYDPMSPKECNSERFSVASQTANDIDRFDFRLRGIKEGQTTIEALERAIKRMRDAGLDKEENMRFGYLVSSLGNLRDQKGISDADRSIKNTFWVLHRIEMSDKELLEFSNFLVVRDPGYPSWSERESFKDYSRTNGSENPSQVFILKKPERYFEAYLEFKKTKR